MLNKICAFTLFVATTVSAESPPPWSPESYPDNEGFTARKQIILEGLARDELGKWRRGYFAGGDPGKYLPGHAMAKLLLNPEDPDPGRFMNDDRSHKEHYHFAAVNWARFWPLFGEQILTEKTQKRFTRRQKNYDYLYHGGTENHKTMWWSSANVLPLFTDAGMNGLSKEETLSEAKEILREYVKGLYQVGQGEWDSGTYLAFKVNGLLNIFDFSEDEECRLFAQAGLDYMVAAYALKYTDGLFAGPNQRGYGHASYRSISDQTGYLWWGGTKTITSANTRDFRYTLHPITSTWKPGRVLHNLATKQITGLPVEQRNSKANYWHGRGLTPIAGDSHESLYLHPRFTLGSLWNAYESQATRFQLVVNSSEGAVAFTGGHPRQSDHNEVKTGIGYHDGTGRYVQSAQSGPVYLSMAKAPEDETEAYSFFSIPERFRESGPRTIGTWKVFDVEGIQVCIRPLVGELLLSETAPDKKGVTTPILKSPGRSSGFLVWVLDQKEDLESSLASVKVIASTFDTDGRVHVEVPEVTTISATFDPDPHGDNHGRRSAKVHVDGAPVDLASWEIYSGPILKQTPGVLTVNDGSESFTIDFTGDLPVYR